MLEIIALIAALQMKVTCLQSVSHQLDFSLQVQRMMQIPPIRDISDVKTQCHKAGIEVNETTFPDVFIGNNGNRLVK